jgi:hypothetical protein
MKYRILILVTYLACFSLQAQSNKWKSHFDGKTLNGWDIILGGKWEVKDGAILGTSSIDEKRHGILITKQKFKDFTIRIKYKVTKGNSGLYFRVDRVEDAVSVYGFQAEIDGNHVAGGLYETGGRAWVIKPTDEEMKKWYKPDAWNEMSVTAKGGDVIVIVNGMKTAELKNDPGRKEGYIGFQLHGGNEMYVEFKDIEISEL